MLQNMRFITDAHDTYSGIDAFARVLEPLTDREEVCCHWLNDRTFRSRTDIQQAKGVSMIIQLEAGMRTGLLVPILAHDVDQPLDYGSGITVIRRIGGIIDPKAKRVHALGRFPFSCRE